MEIPAPAPQLPTPIPAAKRTHARRSCELCKVRKTRCELPDINVESGHGVLPPDKACHRCKTLSLPCTVDDVARKPGKKRARQEEEAAAAGMDSGVLLPVKTRQSKAAKARAAEGSGSGDGIDHSLEVMHGIHPQLDWIGNEGEPALYSSDPFLRSSPISSSFGANVPPVNVMRLHGRALEMVCAMLRVAYSKSEIKDGYAALVVERINWAELVDGPMREKLDIGFAQLCTYHPYLDPLHVIFDKFSLSPAPEDQLLLSTIAYLCTLVLVPTPAVLKLRSFLRPRITFYRNRVLLQAPTSFTAIQALDILGLHAPLGVVPLQLVDPRSISVARGQVTLLSAISAQLKFSVFFKGIASKEAENVWNLSDCLLFLSITALEAGIALEDEYPKPPAALAEVRQISMTYLDESREYLWRNGRDSIGAASLLGRLGLFDRLCRLGEVLESLGRLRVTLESAAKDTTFNPVDAISDEFAFFATKMEACDTRHDSILAILAPFPNNLEQGYLTYRSMRRRYEHIKVLSLGLRCLIASSYIPGSRLALPGVPSDIPAHRRVDYAMTRADNPADIMAILTQNSLATMVIWQYGAHRNEISQQILSCLADLEAQVIPKSRLFGNLQPGEETLDNMAGGSGEESAKLLPLHECIVFAVDGAKMLMEARAGTLLLQKRNGNLQDATLTPIWVSSLKRACRTLRLIGLLSPPNPTGGKEEGGGETIANGCSNILGSMVRMTEEWSRAGQGASMDETREAMLKIEDGVSNGDPFQSFQQGEREVVDGVELFRRDQAEQHRIRQLKEQQQMESLQQQQQHTMSDLLGQQQQQQQHHEQPLLSHHSPYPPMTQLHHLPPHDTDHPFGPPPPQTQPIDHPSYTQAYPSMPPHPEAPPQGYMGSSDRWMAGPGSGEGSNNPYQQTTNGQYSVPHPHPMGSIPPVHVQNGMESGQHHHQGQTMNAHGYPPTALDLLLGQMFQYGPPPQ